MIPVPDPDARAATPERRVPAAPTQDSVFRPVSAGVVSALVGFTSAFVVVLSGLAAVGANPDQASSGLLAVSVTMGLSCILLAWWTRMPITVAWSTPGAALLATTGTVAGGWPAAVGAFLVTGGLIVLTGLVPRLGALIASIPEAAPGRVPRVAVLPSRRANRASRSPAARLNSRVPPTIRLTGSHASTIRGTTEGL